MIKCTQDSCCESDVVTTLLLIHSNQSLPLLLVRYNWVSIAWSQSYNLKPDALKPAISPVFCSLPCRQTDKLKPPKQWVKYTGTFLAMNQTSSTSPVIQVSSSPLYSKYCMIYSALPGPDSVRLERLAPEVKWEQNFYIYLRDKQNFTISNQNLRTFAAKIILAKSQKRSRNSQNFWRKCER